MTQRASRDSSVPGHTGQTASGWQSFVATLNLPSPSSLWPSSQGSHSHYSIFSFKNIALQGFAFYLKDRVMGGRGTDHSSGGSLSNDYSRWDQARPKPETSGIRDDKAMGSSLTRSATADIAATWILTPFAQLTCDSCSLVSKA